MSELERQGGTLTPEELEALLGELAGAQQERDRSALPLAAEPPPGGSESVRRLLDRFGLEQGRALASRFQRRIELRLLEVEELRANELGEILLAEDRLVVFGGAPEGERGALAFSRPLFFAWLRLALGSAEEEDCDDLPRRAYTPIECRFLRLVGVEMVERLAELLGRAVAVLGVEDARALEGDRSARLLLATFDATGFGALGRVRFALPLGWLAGRAAAADVEVAGGAAARLESALQQAPVRLTAEVGTFEIALSQLASLRIGQTVPITTPRDGLVLARVDGVPKFRAERGEVGPRLALRLVERVGSRREEHGSEFGAV
ncbi:MAG: FliM/FliN family flagellar motor switch protein [Myxococcota bacterium]|nr:FliM/FliN family flagellar motor switch protein [Myxococcota bacterium]